PNCSGTALAPRSPLRLPSHFASCQSLANVGAGPPRRSPCVETGRASPCLPVSWREVLLEPVPRHPCDLLQRAGLLKQMRRAGDDLHVLLSADPVVRLLVTFDNRLVLPADNQQRRGFDICQAWRGEVRPAPV